MDHGHTLTLREAEIDVVVVQIFPTQGVLLSNPGISTGSGHFRVDGSESIPRRIESCL